MSISRKQLIACTIVSLAGVIWYFGNGPSAVEHRANAISEATSDTGWSNFSPNKFVGYECTEDCSGHKAGYAWAEEHDISDGDACDTAGERSNSPSFAEGCHAYVDGDADPGKSEDSDNDN
jgi:hypothetical protein